MRSAMLPISASNRLQLKQFKMHGYHCADLCSLRMQEAHTAVRGLPATGIAVPIAPAATFVLDGTHQEHFLAAVVRG